MLDLAAEPRKVRVPRLLAGADVLIENLRPGAIGRLGFGWKQVSALNPALVMCSISAFGQTGPDAGRPGYGALAEARAGLSEMTGEPGGPPVSGQIPVADMMAAVPGLRHDLRRAGRPGPAPAAVTISTCRCSTVRWNCRTGRWSGIPPATAGTARRAAVATTTRSCRGASSPPPTAGSC